MKTALVFGRANGVWGEIAHTLEIAGSFDEVFAVGSAGVDYPGPFKHWVTFHPSSFPIWIEKRSFKGYPPATYYWTNARPRKMTQSGWPIPLQFVSCQGGSSGLVAVHVALDECEADRVVLAGIPMDPERGQYDSNVPWDEALKHRGAWEMAVDKLRGRVKSMSGWTQQLLGAPTAEWLHDEFAQVV